jgi:predicted ABC-type ATPase
MKKRIIIVGGANGVGKTTFAYQYRDEYRIDYLGADEIAQQIKATEKGNAEVKAGKLFFKRLDTYLENKRSVIIESTLSGLGLAKRLEAFRTSGYTLHFVYIFLDSSDLCNKRIKARVEKGGHNVPPHDVDRRYLRSLKNFVHVYMPMADKWIILYNGIKRPVEIAVGEKNNMMILDDEFYRKFREIAQ